jgi:hypothetical protein
MFPIVERWLAESQEVTLVLSTAERRMEDGCNLKPAGDLDSQDEADTVSVRLNNK